MYTYTLLDLQSKTLGELKKIGWELNVIPEGDRRRRETWIDAIAGINPPLLQLLEVSPAVEVDRVCEAIELATETSPGVEVDRVSEVPCEYPRNARRDCPRCVGIQSLYQTRNFVMESWVIRCLYCDYERFKDPRGAYLAAPEPVHGPDEYPWKKEAILQASAYQSPPPSYTPPGDYCCTWAPLAPSTQTFSAVDSFPEAIEVQAQEPIIETVEASPGVEVGQAQEPPIESKFGRIVYPRPTQGAIVQNEETTPDLDRTGGADVHNRSFHPTNSDGDNSSIEAETLGSEESDRVLAVAGNHQAVRGLFLPHQSLKLAAENSPAVEVDQAQEAIESPPAALVCPSCSAVHALYTDNDYLYRPVIRCLHCSYCRSKNYLGPIRIEVQEPISQVAKNSPAVEVDRVSEPISQVAKNSPAVEVDRVEDKLPECSECFDDGFIEDGSGFIKICQCEPKLSRQSVQNAIVPAAKNLPGRSKTSTAHQLLELFKSSAHIIDDSPASETELKVSQSAIEQAGKNQESDLNPILTGLSLSDRFLARYSPPQSEVFQFQADADGQLTLIDFKVQSAPEPPDPDDFDSLDAFREAIALWDAQNPELLAVSMDSMCEWAPCPEEWYEPEAESLPLKPSSMMELSPPAIESSITSDFFIPTFDAWCDRENRQTDTDEPPDTGIFARLRGPKPPKFPPGAIGYTQPNSPLNAASRNYSETIPKLFSRVAAGSRTQPARSPPGGDA